MDLKELLAPVEEEFDVDEALAEWRWLVPEPVRPLVVTACGDVFLVAPSGAVLFLDTLAGTYEEVAPSVDAWRREIQNPERLDEWFMPAWLFVLRDAGIYLSEGQCYSALHSIILGGSFTVDNWRPTHWRVHFAASGRLHEQVNKLPPGTKIAGIKYDRLK